MSNLRTLVGGAAGGGLAALLMSAKYSSNAAAAVALGPVYPIYLIGGTVIGSYLGNYFGKSKKK